ncbi:MULTISPECIES: putative polysaccharide biosynthesis protein [unclassified Paenibacillus]|uniref:putative polysaccharide biosynthesis protein n=1 Tax=unclassified Paenibacillus TaxID=185978 RepID=UPI003633D27C
MAKDSLVKGTFILAMAALVARALGVVQRVPLVILLGDIGMAAYGTAFNIYSMLLVVATAGIPSALSKMISERTTLGLHAEANRIYRAALLFAAAAGLVMTLFLFIIAPYYSNSIINPQASLPIRALAPALLLFPMIAIMRGYFQGRRMMMPNGLSQIIEQLFRVVTSVGLAYVLLAHSMDWAIAGASFGGVIGSVAAAAVMLYYAIKLRRSDRAEGLLPSSADSKGSLSADPNEASREGVRRSTLSFKIIYAQLFKISIPIVIFSLTVTLIYTIDSSIVTLLLRDQVGEVQAKEILGILLGRAQSLAGIPIILAVALSQSVVPIISSAYSQKDMKQVSQQTGKVLQLSILTGLPAVLIICLAAGPINDFIFGNDKGSAIVDAYAAPIIVFLTVSTIFQIVMQTSGAVLMGMGKMRVLMLSVAAGIVLKLVGSYVLAPWFGIYGIIAATCLCFVLMTIMNLQVLRKEVPFRVLGSRRWLGMGITTVVMVIAGVLLDRLTSSYVVPFGSLRGDAFIQAVIISAVVGGLYPLLLMITRTLSVADLQQLPRPIQRIIGKVAPKLLKSTKESGSN